jgi:predicted MPP superfamily phosphohydrolase
VKHRRIRDRPRRFVALPELAQHEIDLPGLDPRHDGIRIAHLTDVHCGRMTPERHVRAAVELANAARPDLIVMTGDYVNWSRDEVSIAGAQLAGLSAAPVVVTLGNHDYFAWGEGVAAAMAGNGYTVLRNQHHTVDVAGAPLHVIGIDDPVTGRHDLEAAFAEVPDGGSRLVLCHCPEQIDEIAERGAHLMLSGHTHGGQINVRGITDRIFRKTGRRYFNRGFYTVGNTRLYVSSGVGFSGVRVRAGEGTRAEVSLFTCRAAALAAASPAA